MTNANNTGCFNGCVTNSNCSSSGMPNFSFILVLFILLVICGTAYIF